MKLFLNSIVVMGLLVSLNAQSQSDNGQNSTREKVAIFDSCIAEKLTLHREYLSSICAYATLGQGIASSCVGTKKMKYSRILGVSFERNQKTGSIVKKEEVLFKTNESRVSYGSNEADRQLQQLKSQRVCP